MTQPQTRERKGVPLAPGSVAFVDELIRERKLTRAKVAERMGVEPSEVTRLLGGKSGYRSAMLEKLARALDVEPGRILDAATAPETRRTNARFQSSNVGEEMYRALYEYGVAGDPLNQDDAPPAADRIPIPPGAPDEIRRNPDSFGVRVRGSSMEGMKITEGSIVWCLPARDARVAQGEPVVAWIQNERDDLHGNVVKQYLHAAGPNGQNCLGSVYADGKREIVYCDEFKVVGIVKAIQPPTIVPMPLRPPLRHPGTNDS